MSLPAQWTTPEDFATLFQYFWHRDFPIDQRATGARRTDRTIHIDVVVRSLADLMDLVTRFERGGRKDAVLITYTHTPNIQNGTGKNEPATKINVIPKSIHNNFLGTQFP